MTLFKNSLTLLAAALILGACNSDKVQEVKTYIKTETCQGISTPARLEGCRKGVEFVLQRAQARLAQPNGEGRIVPGEIAQEGLSYCTSQYMKSDPTQPAQLFGCNIGVTEAFLYNKEVTDILASKAESLAKSAEAPPGDPLDVCLRKGDSAQVARCISTLPAEATAVDQVVRYIDEGRDLLVTTAKNDQPKINDNMASASNDNAKASELEAQRTKVVGTVSAIEAVVTATGGYIESTRLYVKETKALRIEAAGIPGRIENIQRLKNTYEDEERGFISTATTKKAQLRMAESDRDTAKSDRDRAYLPYSRALNRRNTAQQKKTDAETKIRKKKEAEEKAKQEAKRAQEQRDREALDAREKELRKKSETSKPAFGSKPSDSSSNGSKSKPSFGTKKN